MRYITPEHCIASRLGGRPAPKWAAAFIVCRDYPGSQQALATFENVRPVRYRLLCNMTHTEFEPLVFEADVAGRTIVIVTRVVWGGPQMAILVEELERRPLVHATTYFANVCQPIRPAMTHLPRLDMGSRSQGEQAPFSCKTGIDFYIARR